MRLYTLISFCCHVVRTPGTKTCKKIEWTTQVMHEKKLWEVSKRNHHNFLYAAICAKQKLFYLSIRLLAGEIR